MGAEVDLRLADIPDDLRRRVPAEIATRYRVLPVSWEDGTLVVGLADPGNLPRPGTGRATGPRRAGPTESPPT